MNEIHRQPKKRSEPKAINKPFGKAEYIAALKKKYKKEELRRTIQHLESKRVLAADEVRILSMMRKALKTYGT